MPDIHDGDPCTELRYLRTLIGDVTEEFDLLVFDELDTIVRTLLEDITDEFDEATNA